jgi:hypothetical protein
LQRDDVLIIHIGGHLQMEPIIINRQFLRRHPSPHHSTLSSYPTPTPHSPTPHPSANALPIKERRNPVRIEWNNKLAVATKSAISRTIRVASRRRGNQGEQFKWSLILTMGFLYFWKYIYCRTGSSTCTRLKLSSRYEKTKHQIESPWIPVAWHCTSWRLKREGDGLVRMYCHGSPS